jgi:hypothetical protein
MLLVCYCELCLVTQLACSRGGVLGVLLGWLPATDCIGCELIAGCLLAC